MAVWRFLVGPPRRARDASREQITPLEGLSALSLDALTLMAYGPEAVIVVLATAGAGALPLVLPVTIAIVALLAILVFSYRQVIDAYPGGGGAYAVSRASLGSCAGLVAAGPGRSLLPSRTLATVSVLLVLKAFSAGCSALTGVEAIANGVPLFKQPRQVRAKRTELLLGVILGAMLVGLAVLAGRWHIRPRPARPY